MDDLEKKIESLIEGYDEIGSGEQQDGDRVWIILHILKDIIREIREISPSLN